VPSPILFFDGVCGICNHFVKFLFQVDRKAVFKVATLQGSFAQKNLPKALTQELSSLVVLTDKGETLTKSRAVLFVLRSVGGIWRMLAAAAGILPTNVLDRIYERVARNRYRFFGKLESCRVPTPEEKMRFIDDRHHPPA
jgi:predicted DCC family thiol-disulfide oxidoreductase YuxK